MSERPTPISARDALTIARIVRVNHAGEYGAIRIYTAQIGVSAKRYPDVVPALADMLQHEKKHCAAFFAAMPQRQSRPCRIMSLWSWGGWLLGFATALMGRQAIWVCTAAVKPPSIAISTTSSPSCRIVTPSCMASSWGSARKKLSHLHHAESQITAFGPGGRLLRRLISDLTDALIWLSTWGELDPHVGRSAHGNAMR